MRKTLLFFILLLSLSVMANDKIDKRVVYLWDVTYSMHGGLHGSKFPSRNVVIAGQPEEIKQYNKKYDIYTPVLEALVKDIQSQSARTEVVVIPFNINVCGEWAYQATDANKQLLIKKIQNYSNLAQTYTSIYNALHYAQMNVLKNDVPNELKILTDGNEYKDTYNDFISALKSWCDFADKNNVVASYYFILSDDILKEKPELKNLLESNCFVPTTGGGGGTVVLTVKPNYNIQEKLTISTVDDYGKPLSIAFNPEKVEDKLKGSATIEVSINSDCLSLSQSIEVDSSTDKLVLNPKWLMSQSEARNTLPLQSQVKVEYKVKKGDLVLLTTESVITIKNKKVKKMNLEFK